MSTNELDIPSKSTPLQSHLMDAIIARFKQEFSRPITIYHGITQTNSISFPLKGIVYYFQHPKLWPMFIRILPPLLIVHLTVLIGIFATLFPFNAASLIITCGPLALFPATFLTLQESGFVSSFILSNYLTPKPMDNLFDYVLCLEGLEKVVIPGKLKRVVGPSFGDFVVEKTIWFPFEFPFMFVGFMRPIVLSCIPILGHWILNLENATTKGESSQSRYYKLARLRDRQINYLAKEREGDYLSFGIVATFLESIPLLGTFFYFTNQIGGALMAANYYKEGREFF
ncbi:hypothetical protein CANARDRAFT_27497 [[Candida] arabinofermentans NRRL YB-2248]|uniref:Outer spore wall protein RRT8 n=1 Tax=[Candida] arabinofermentans NRRL YB-2248 TaxID=983967 RepID=A0A1E4T3C9_9ASCO|nr:hypothetical protein CANARDRAFT_27497 [[Candida] arabinofermentans NRRL YB-2248]